MTPQFQADLAKAFATFKLPSFDLEALSELQSKNVEAVMQASKLLTDAGKALVQRQMDVATQGIELAVKASQQVLDASTPEAKFTTQIDATKAAYSRATAAVQDLAELMAKPGQKAADILQARFVAQARELENMLAKAA